jgi:hypothetical protein
VAGALGAAPQKAFTVDRGAWLRVAALARWCLLLLLPASTAACCGKADASFRGFTDTQHYLEPYSRTWSR